MPITGLNKKTLSYDSDAPEDSDSNSDSDSDADGESQLSLSHSDVLADVYRVMANDSDTDSGAGVAAGAASPLSRVNAVNPDGSPNTSANPTSFGPVSFDAIAGHVGPIRGQSTLSVGTHTGFQFGVITMWDPWHFYFFLSEMVRLFAND